MPKTYEYTVELPLEPAALFRLLIDSERWRHSKLYGEIRWMEGEPWQPGATREVETLLSYRRKHRQRVLARRENELLELVSHGFGYTNHVQLELRPAPGGGTTLRIVNLVEGFLPLIFGNLDSFMTQIVQAWIEETRRLCAEEQSTQRSAVSRPCDESA